MAYRRKDEKFNATLQAIKDRKVKQAEKRARQQRVETITKLFNACIKALRRK